MAETKNVLILEDNSMMCNLLKTLLDLEGFNVICPTFPLMDILKVIKDSRSDAILMDINLPGLNGLEILKMIRNSDDINSIKVIIISGSDRKKESIEAGADHFLMKPYIPDELIQILKNLS
ncbi:MAG: response regulator [Leptolinea sp.]|nr:response regulator [Leptolinea sp.]